MEGIEVLSPGKLSERSVLIVDEDVYFTRLLGSILESFEVGKITVLHDYDSAVEMLEAEDFDCLITDWLSDGLKGLYLVTHIRHSSTICTPEIPIILCTGMTGYDRIVSARDAGVSEILSKPVVPCQILKKLAVVFTEQREFISSENYIGPDRRRRQMPFKGDDRRGKYGLDQATIDSVMKEDHHGASQ